MITSKKVNYANLIIYFLILLSLGCFIYLSFINKVFIDISLNNLNSITHIICAVIVIILLSSLTFNKNLKKTFLLMFFSFSFSILFVELSLPFFSSLNKKVKFYDGDSRFKIYYKFKDQLNMTISLHPHLFISENGIKNTTLNKTMFPLSGIANKTTLLCREMNKWEIFQSDRFGFNNPDIVWDLKKIDYLLIGDSFTQGLCVDNNNTIAANLRTKLSNSLINLGHAGSGPLIEFAILNEYGSIKKPKKVIWFYFEGNDLENLSRHDNLSFLKKYLNNSYSQNLPDYQTELDLILEKYLDAKSKEFYLKDLTKNLRLYNIRKILKSLNPSYERKIVHKETFDLFSKIIRLSKKKIQSWDGELIFVYLPDGRRFINDKNTIKYDTEKKNILTIVKKLDITVIDFNKEFLEQQKEPLSFYTLKGLAHFTEKGYKALANTIGKQLID